MRHCREAQAFSADEINFLQDCFDTILARHGLEPRTARAEDVASALFLAFQRGVRDRHELLRLADLCEV